MEKINLTRYCITPEADEQAFEDPEGQWVKFKDVEILFLQHDEMYHTLFPKDGGEPENG